MPRSPRPALPGGPYLVVGLARSGIAAALALHARGERTIGVDAGAPDLERLVAAGVEVHANESGERFLDAVRTVVKSPGVPSDAPVVLAARACGLEVIGELELAWRLLPNRFIAVTGTNGKTTTTELIGHIYRAAGEPVEVAGNVGTAVSSLVGEVGSDVTIVCETSSFQLEDTTAFAPDAAVLLNLALDHLDRHGSLPAYRAAKLNAFSRQRKEDFSVSPVELVSELPGEARRITFGDRPDLRGGPRSAAVTLRDGVVSWQGLPRLAAQEVSAAAADPEPLMRAEEIGLPGEHNLDNAMAAAAVALASGIPSERVSEGLRTFPGVAHRLESIAEIDGVAYVNDSKATNVASTAVALRSYPSDPPRVHLIAGGVTKSQDFAPLAPLVAERCRSVHLIGEGAGEIAGALRSTGVELHDDGDLAHALAAARQTARPGDVVLLSPACASFDQFRDFEARGDRFRALVGEI